MICYVFKMFTTCNSAAFLLLLVLLVRPGHIRAGHRLIGDSDEAERQVLDPLVGFCLMSSDPEDVSSEEDDAEYRQFSSNLTRRRNLLSRQYYFEYTPIDYTDDEYMLEELGAVCPHLPLNEGLCCGYEELESLRRLRDTMWRDGAAICMPCLENIMHVACKLTCDAHQSRFTLVSRVDNDHHDLSDSGLSAIEHVVYFADGVKLDAVLESCRGISQGTLIKSLCAFLAVRDCDNNAELYSRIGSYGALSTYTFQFEFVDEMEGEKLAIQPSVNSQVDERVRGYVPFNARQRVWSCDSEMTAQDHQEITSIAWSRDEAAARARVEQRMIRQMKKMVSKRNHPVSSRQYSEAKDFFLRGGCPCYHCRTSCGTSPNETLH